MPLLFFVCSYQKCTVFHFNNNNRIGRFFCQASF
nr:MAG TPA: hypothetical protein [Caudoviricetes sp.]